eukprot:TRINITY_DN16440_c0_g1_i1.p1 TRINITY_DN16440_c0_g1~~TRINITY_DN16440_c0_g1_i1.p1  ORF type:complete len:103 (-),score=7.85 TRINITY_DN16440_c0_g1_i1:179-442(-)
MASMDIDSEDDAWDGTIDPTAFKQDREKQERARIIARLEAQNRGPQPGGTSTTKASTSEPPCSMTTASTARGAVRGAPLGTAAVARG